MTAAKTPGKQRGRPFQKGQSGNPSGRPRGSRHKVSLAIDSLLAGEAEVLTRKAIDLALEGDLIALRLCLERLCPPVKQRPIRIDMPTVESAAEAVGAMTVVLESMSQGEITPGEAQALADVIEQFRRVLEVEELEQRVAALEDTRGVVE